MVIEKLAAALLIAGAAAPAPVMAQDTSPTAHEARLTQCRPGAPESSPSQALRPTPTARCPYDLAGLYRRFENMLGRKNVRGYDVTSAALTFGLPAMTSQYDSDRSASYQMRVDGKGGWTMRLWVRESAYPLDGKPPAFVPGVQPRRLIDVDRLDVRYDITIIAPDGKAGPGKCLSVADAETLLTAGGWEDKTTLANLSIRDGGVAAPTFEAPRGTTITLQMPDQDHIATPAERAAHCVSGITVMQPPLNNGSAE